MKPGAPIYDLVIIGGGINGAGIARDAAGRGYSVCLIEQDDLASHTSSASTKLIHGGLRYLEHGELKLVRESLTERERLLGIAPHLIRPLRFVLPYVDGLRPRWLLRLGLFVYDHVGGREQLAASESLHLKDSILGAPLNTNIESGFEYSDCWVDDSRLVILNAVDAAERGASILTRTRLLSATATAEGWQLQCQRRTPGEAALLLRARALVNASGAWVNDVVERCGLRPQQRLRLVQGSHLVLKRLYEGDHAYLFQSPDQRVVFAIPYQAEFTLVGTTDRPFTGDPAQVKISDEERRYLLTCLNQFLRTPVQDSQIVSEFSGVRPLYDDGSASSAQRVSRDYLLELQQASNGSTLLSVYGGKITTYRRLAEAAMRALQPTLGPSASVNDAHDEGWTAIESLPGGDLPGLAAGLAPSEAWQAFMKDCHQRWPQLPSSMLERLAQQHGTRIERVLGNAASVQDMGPIVDSELTRAEARYLIRHEWACTAEDILWRRTRLGLKCPASGVHQLQNAVTDLL